MKNQIMFLNILIIYYRTNCNKDNVYIPVASIAKEVQNNMYWQLDPLHSRTKIINRLNKNKDYYQCAEGNALLIKPILQAIRDHADLSNLVFDNDPIASAKI